MNALTAMADKLIWHMRDRLIADEFDMILRVIREALDKVQTAKDAEASILNIIEWSQGDDLFLNMLTQQYFSCVNEYQRSNEYETGGM